MTLRSPKRRGPEGSVNPEPANTNHIFSPRFEQALHAADTSQLGLLTSLNTYSRYLMERTHLMQPFRVKPGDRRDALTTEEGLAQLYEPLGRLPDATDEIIQAETVLAAYGVRPTIFKGYLEHNHDDFVLIAQIKTDTGPLNGIIAFNSEQTGQIKITDPEEGERIYGSQERVNVFSLQDIVDAAWWIHYPSQTERLLEPSE